jgi:hypothetical protein
MANNTDPTAVRVANEKIRPACDKLLQAYWFMKNLQAQYTAQQWAALFPSADPTGEVIDGARTDGRKVLTNADVNAAITALGAFITFMEATSNQQLNRFLLPSVNPERT